MVDFQLSVKRKQFMYVIRTIQGDAFLSDVILHFVVVME